MNRPRSYWFLFTCITLVLTLVPTKTMDMSPRLFGYRDECFRMEELKTEVGEYIKKNAPNSRLSPGYLVETCLKHNVDICLVLAQGHLESHFGTIGKAAKTNSVWNVINRTYEHPDSSLVPYLSTLNDTYLSNGRTVVHLLESFTTTDGKRYAEHTEYEKRLASIYRKIRTTTNIHESQEKLVGQPGATTDNND